MSAFLTREWEVWAARNALRGVPRAEIEARLVAEGVSAELAARTLDDLLSSPLFEAARPLQRDARRWQLTAKLRARLVRDAQNPARVVERERLSVEEFFDVFYASGTPVLVRGFLRDWPAMQCWQLDALRERFGDAQVDITTGRVDSAEYQKTFRRPSERLALRDFIDRIQAASTPTNDFYLVAQNKAIEGPLRGMIDDIPPCEGFIDRAGLATDCLLWMGPAGTVTALHHDPQNVLACHVVGRKRWRLIAPTERGLLDRVSAPFTSLDPDALDDVLVKDVLVSPGDALFVPVGWWHHVTTLDASVMVSITCLPRENQLLWYNPGPA